MVTPKGNSLPRSFVEPGSLPEPLPNLWEGVSSAYAPLGSDELDATDSVSSGDHYDHSVDLPESLKALEALGDLMSSLFRHARIELERMHGKHPRYVLVENDPREQIGAGVSGSARGNSTGSSKDPKTLQTMGKQSRTKKERREGTLQDVLNVRVILGTDGLASKGQKFSSYLKYYYSRKLQSRDRELLQRLEDDSYELALKFVILQDNVDSVWERELERTKRDQASLKEAVISSFERVFPSAKLPTSKGKQTELIEAWEGYKKGEIGTRRVYDVLMEFGGVNKPIVSQGVVQLGSMTFTWEDVLEFFRRSCEEVEEEKNGSNYLKTYERLKQAISSRGRLNITTQDRLVANREGAIIFRDPVVAMPSGAKIRTDSDEYQDALLALQNDVALKFLAREDIPDITKQQAAVLFAFLSADDLSRFGLLFNPLGYSNVATKPADEVIAIFKKMMLDHFNVGGAEERPVTGQGVFEPLPDIDNIEPLPLSSFNGLDVFSDRPEPARSLAIFKHGKVLIYLIAGKLRAIRHSTMEQSGFEDENIRVVERFLTDERYAMWARAMMADLSVQMAMLHPDVWPKLAGLIDSNRGDIAALEGAVDRFYAENVPYSESIIEQSVHRSKHGYKILSDRIFSRDTVAKGWAETVAAAKRHGIGKERMMLFFSDMMEVVDLDPKIYEYWMVRFPYLAEDLSDDVWDRIRNYEERMAPSLDPVAISTAEWFNDVIFPPQGRWSPIDANFPDFTGAGFPEDDLRDMRIKLRFLFPKEIEALYSTLVLAREETEVTYKAYRRVYENKPLSVDFPILERWLSFRRSETLHNASKRLLGWANGEVAWIDPHLVRSLIRRSLGDTLMLRSLMMLAADTNMPGEKLRKIFGMADRLMKMGRLNGDFLCCIFRATGIVEPENMKGAKAELLTVELLLQDGAEVRLVPTDKNMRQKRPDVMSTSADGQISAVEVKSVMRRIGDVDYINDIRTRINEAALQLRSFVRGDPTVKRIVHIHLLTLGKTGISEMLINEVKRFVESGDEAVKELDGVLFVPVDLSSGEWVHGEPVMVDLK